MNATWGLDRYVSQTMQVIVRERAGVIRGWPLLRVMWLSGALADCLVPVTHWDPESPCGPGSAAGPQGWPGPWISRSENARN
jgi:hypothetical protein